MLKTIEGIYMTFPVEITPNAEIHIEEAYRWYRERNPEFADRLNIPKQTDVVSRKYLSLNVA